MLPGMKLIVPSSVDGTGVTVSASGKVSFTSTGDAGVNGCFDSTYDNYVIIGSHITDSQSNQNFRLRASAVEASGSDYEYERILISNTSVASALVTGSVWLVTSASTTQYCGFILYVYGPALAQKTCYRSISCSSANDAQIFDMSGDHGLATSYDGFTLKATTGLLTGSLTVYGLTQ